MNIKIGDFVTTKTKHKGVIRTIKEYKGKTICFIVETGDSCYPCPIELINEYKGE